jgi:hypothetical protein
MAVIVAHDDDLQIFSEVVLSTKSRRRIIQSLNDLDQEIPRMPAQLRIPFRIVRDIIMEVLAIA